MMVRISSRKELISMNVKELSKEQLLQLKQNYLCEIQADNGGISYGELVAVDDIITDEEIYETYKDYIFVDDDF